MDTWELIEGSVAREIEYLNYQNQMTVLEGLIRFLLAHHGPTGTGKAPMPDQNALLQLHYSGTLFLLAEPGRYRRIPVVVSGPPGSKDKPYNPPSWDKVNGLMQHFFRSLSSLWSAGAEPSLIAAYALWRINWIHPFVNGNGRTARAFAYACLSLRLGTIIPGPTTLIELMRNDERNYQEYLIALKEADANERKPDLGKMQALIERLLGIQWKSRIPTDKAYVTSPMPPVRE